MKKVFGWVFSFGGKLWQTAEGKSKAFEAGASGPLFQVEAEAKAVEPKKVPVWRSLEELVQDAVVRAQSRCESVSITDFPIEHLEDSDDGYPYEVYHREKRAEAIIISLTYGEKLESVRGSTVWLNLQFWHYQKNRESFGLKVREALEKARARTAAKAKACELRDQSAALSRTGLAGDEIEARRLKREAQALYSEAQEAADEKHGRSPMKVAAEELAPALALALKADQEEYWGHIATTGELLHEATSTGHIRKLVWFEGRPWVIQIDTERGAYRAEAGFRAPSQFNDQELQVAAEAEGRYRSTIGSDVEG